MAADLAIVVLGKARLIGDVESGRHARQDECAGKTRQHGATLAEKGILFMRAHNAAPKSLPRPARFASENQSRQYT